MLALWKLNRLRAMGLRELAFRVGRLVQARAEQVGLGLAAAPQAASSRTGSAWCDALPSRIDATAYLNAADDLLAGRFDVFAMRRAELGFPPRWNRDPKTGTEVPLQFGKGIDYRDETLVGDVKYLWELNRHLELVTLAQAWHLSRDPKYSQGCRVLLESWFEECPYTLGVNWTSALEAALRLVNWYFAWHLLSAEDGPAFGGEGGASFRARWQTAVFQHCHFVAGHLSLHSSANNHLLGEYLGLFVGSVGWPLWRESAQWHRVAHAGFETQALLQNAPDGVNREQAIYYQHEVADMMLLCGLIGKANGLTFSDAYWQRLERMLGFIDALMDIAGHVPSIGDADDARIVRLAPHVGFDIYGSLLATGAVLFERADFARRARSFDDKSRWLLGDGAEARFASLRAETTPTGPSANAFPEGGYYLLQCDRGGPNEIHLVADAGPLGYLSIAAHGHADALALTLSAGGRELLIDPGTYAYHTQREWRDYFRGTRAHNTVCVDGKDQSESGGSFLWIEHAKARCEVFESSADRERFVGSHDGYRRLTDPLTHRREIVLYKQSLRVTVHDWLECAATHAVEVLWHFAEHCVVDVRDRRIYVTNGRVRLCMQLTGADFQAECVTGRETPPLGWVSRSFDTKVPSPTLRFFGRVAGPTHWTTTFDIRIDDAHHPSAVDTSGSLGQ